MAAQEPRMIRWKRWSVRRTIDTYEGDFNKRVSEILDPGIIRPREPTFCLIDQRTFECEWHTLQRIAAHRSEPLYKIELFYFLAHSWFDRAIAATTTEQGKRQIRRWWGGDGWQALRSATGMQRAEAFTRRFTRELHYKWAAPYAIYKRESSTQIAYWMIHATDHPDAPELMDRGQLYFGPPKTKAGRRSVSLPRTVVRELETHLKAWAGEDFVFTAPEGGTLRAQAFRRRFWQPATESAGLPHGFTNGWTDGTCRCGLPREARSHDRPLRPHDLRHTAVAIWIAAGANPKEVAVRAGHTSVAFTLDRYGHLYPDHDEGLRARLDEMILTADSMRDADIIRLR